MFLVLLLGTGEAFTVNIEVLCLVDDLALQY